MEDDSRALRKGIILAVILGLVLLPFFALGALLVREYRNAAFWTGEGVNSQGASEGSGGAQGGCPSSSIQKFRTNTALWAAMNKNSSTYKSAANEGNIPWEMLAAIHYREHHFDTSDPNGEGPYQLTSYYNAIQSGRPPRYKGKTVTLSDIQSFPMASRLAADILQQKVAGRGGPLTQSPTDNLVKDAFWGYNGRAYGSEDRSPYVMNNFDEQHRNMVISGFIRGRGNIRAVDTNDGAYTVYYLLRYLGTYDGSGHLTGFKDCEQSSSSDDTASTSGAVGRGGNSAQGGYLPVPGVKQKTRGDCGQAAVLMIARYYTELEGRQLRDPYYDHINNQTVDDIGCVTPVFLNKHTPFKDWIRTNPSQQAGIESVKRSLAAGVPVVMYTSPGAIVSGEHIVAITGYDPVDKSFWINSSFERGCDCYPDKGPRKNFGGRKTSEDRLINYFGGLNRTYGHTFIIRSVFK